MRTSRVHVTSGWFERVAGERAMISVTFVNLRRHFSRAYHGLSEELTHQCFQCRLFSVDSRIIQQLFDAL